MANALKARFPNLLHQVLFFYKDYQPWRYLEKSAVDGFGKELKEILESLGK